MSDIRIEADWAAPDQQQPAEMLVRAQTDAGRAWLVERTDGQWRGDAMAVASSRVWILIEDADRDGLTLATGYSDRDVERPRNARALLID